MPPARLSTRAPDFEARFAGLIAARRAAGAYIAADVTAIIEDVRQRGDTAVIDYTERFDRLTLAPESLAISADERARARSACDPKAREALELAGRRIAAFHRRQMPGDLSYKDETGLELGHRWRPIDRVGIYVPGGHASYPSSVLMNALPARVAGVRDIVMCVPAPNGNINPLVLAAAEIAQVKTIYRIGGAQAIATLAWGTASVPAVDKIVGPGNAWVAEAKRQVFGRVGIDMVAGPSEIVIVADAGARADWLAADLLAQAEHDAQAQAILMSDDAALIDAVIAALETQLASLPRAAIAGPSWTDHGAVILLHDLDEAADLVNRLAPEHLELAIADPDRLATRIRHAGALFLGAHAPEALGDYLAGPSHVLPTAGSARFSSGLSVFDFLKRTTVIRGNPESLKALAPAAARLARAEGLEGHARSLDIRLRLPDDE